jgi:SAM-dependent methyltransferase
MANVTWEEAVLELRRDPARATLVRDAYYDDPVLDAARRFATSLEWRESARILQKCLPGRVLEIGAGRGIASYAFAKMGSDVVALEPDPSAIVGRGAIEELSRECSTLRSLDARGESIPFPDATFDVVYGRAVLHHAADLTLLCREVGRVLKPGGLALFTREHVVDGPEQLRSFLARHPLHHRYGGEHAYSKAEYVSALRGGELTILRTMGQYETAMNYYPSDFSADLRRRLGPLSPLMKVPGLETLAGKVASAVVRTPGRHYAFLATRRVHC